MSNVKFQVVSQPLDGSDIISILSSFRDLLQSALGPFGRLKILVTGGGYFVVTSSASRLLNYLPLDNPVCLFISQIMKSQLAEFKDNGLYIGILASSLLIQTQMQCKIPVKLVTEIIQKLCSDITPLLNSNNIRVDFTTVTQLIPIVRSIIKSKPTCSLNNSEIETLVISIVKSFLSSASENDFGEVFVISGENSKLSNSIFPGVLYQSGLFHANDQILNSFTNRKKDKMYSLLLINVMLSDDKAEKRRETDCVTLNPDCSKSYDVTAAMRVMKCALELGVNIVACQKVVHPHLCLFLRRNGLLLLDRMGTQLTEQVEKLSGAVPVSDIAKCVDKGCLVPLLGHVSSVRCVKSGTRDYVLLERAGRNVTTLLVGGINAEAAAELKVTTEQALQSLRLLMIQPCILPGAGCMEMALVAALTAKVEANGIESYQCSKIQLQTSLLLLQKSLLSAAGFSQSSLATLSADTGYYHAWQSLEDDWSNCRCGLVTAAMVREARKDWTNLDLNSGILLPSCNAPRKLSVDLLHDKAVVDLFSCKLNAIKLSLECFSGLAGIGMILYKLQE